MSLHSFYPSVPKRVCQISIESTMLQTLIYQMQMMFDKEQIMEIPAKQRMERQETLAKEHREEHKAALRRAVTLSVPDAFSPTAYGTFDEKTSEAEDDSQSSSTRSRQRMSWNELIERIFEKDESGHMVLRKSTSNS